MLDEATRKEPAQHALDHGAERAVRLGEPLLVHAQELLEVLLDQTKEWGLPRPPRPVHPRTDLHTSPQTGGRDRRDVGTGLPCAAGREVCSAEGPSQVLPDVVSIVGVEDSRSKERAAPRTRRRRPRRPGPTWTGRALATGPGRPLAGARPGRRGSPSLRDGRRQRRQPIAHVLPEEAFPYPEPFRSLAVDAATKALATSTRCRSCAPPAARAAARTT